MAGLCGMCCRSTSSPTLPTVEPVPKVLIFSKTVGFHHNSIEVGVPAIKKLGTENKFDVDETKEASQFTTDNLKRYAAVVFLSTTGDVLNSEQEAAFTKYIQGGGGFVGIHAAADCEYDWPWYGRLIGAYFKGHPATQKADLMIVDAEHIATKHLPTIWERVDEWYTFKAAPKNVHVLINIDERSYDVSDDLKMGDEHPMAWYHDYDGGRAFYTELGHTDESFADPLYLQHILGGIKYAMGKKAPKN
ncbi:ThuA domain-containing protein [Mucilaginibacter myungsuensis]|uniref:ThuA domain-containing protein n=2 Tax=Mucilaginibacter myungsuensis TaxID=649104 RepID=A0A929PZJ0_9SPHI|nr:ThuA domain-containing protein [Mucilaginibacter myungsuensis]